MTKKEKFKELYTVVFLVNKIPPERTVLLKRAEWKDFAPGYYTGVGGKVEKGETVDDAALRELQEETGLKNIKLTEFARCLLTNHEKALFYFWGIYPDDKLPGCNEGDLEWVNSGELVSKNIIPTTMLVVREWQERNFGVNRPFTVYAKVTGNSKNPLKRTLEGIEEGLADTIIE